MSVTVSSNQNVRSVSINYEAKEFCVMPAITARSVTISRVNAIGVSGSLKIITQYEQTSLENGFIYSRFLLNGLPRIGRFGTTQQYAVGIENITTDWVNRLNLNYE